MAARRVEWSIPPANRVSKLPSWAVPANAPPPRSEGRPQLRGLPSVKPPPPSASVIPTAASLSPEPLMVEAPASVRQHGLLEEQASTIEVLTAELETVKTTAAKVAAQLATARRRLLEASEGELVKLAIAIAGRVVGEAFEADKAIIARWAKEAIALLPPRESIVVAISTDLAECVPEAAWDIATEGEHRLEIDKTLAPGTCEVRSNATSIEVSASARMAAIGEAIGATS